MCLVSVYSMPYLKFNAINPYFGIYSLIYKLFNKLVIIGVLDFFDVASLIDKTGIFGSQKRLKYSLASFWVYHILNFFIKIVFFNTTIVVRRTEKTLFFHIVFVLNLCLLST